MGDKAMTNRLEAMRVATNEALAKLTKERMAEEPFRRGGVNWADLKCSDVEYVQSVHGEQYYRVTVDEVSPDEDELRTYVADYLKEKGFENVEVVTEW